MIHSCFSIYNSSTKVRADMEDYLLTYHHVWKPQWRSSTDSTLAGKATRYPHQPLLRAQDSPLQLRSSLKLCMHIYIYICSILYVYTMHALILLQLGAIYCPLNCSCVKLSNVLQCQQWYKNITA